MRWSCPGSQVAGPCRVELGRRQQALLKVLQIEGVAPRPGPCRPGRRRPARRTAPASTRRPGRTRGVPGTPATRRRRRTGDGPGSSCGWSAPRPADTSNGRRPGRRPRFRNTALCGERPGGSASQLRPPRPAPRGRQRARSCGRRGPARFSPGQDERQDQVNPAVLGQADRRAGGGLGQHPQEVFDRIAAGSRRLPPVHARWERDRHGHSSDRITVEHALADHKRWKQLTR